jgi:hypothetical protein
MWLLAGVALGVLSRVEEVTDGLFLCISTYTTWCATAYLVGSPGRAVLALTTANAGYYAYVAATEPGVPLWMVAGPPVKWYLLGVAAGLGFGRRRRITLLGLALVAVWEAAGAPVNVV